MKVKRAYYSSECYPRKELMMKVRKLSISLKILLMVSLVTIICSVSMCIMAYTKEKDTLIQLAKDDGCDIAGCAAANVDAEEFALIEPGMEDSQAYQDIYDSLSVYRDNSDVEYIYTMKLLEDGTLVFVIDTDPDDPADIYEEYEMLPQIEESFETAAITADEEISEDEWGQYFSAYAPIIDDNGEMLGIVGVDIGIDWINEKAAQLRLYLIIFCLISVAFGILCAILISNSVRKNLKKLNQKVEAVSSGDGDLTKLVEIHSGDELEVIAGNMNRFIGRIRELVSNVGSTANAVTEGGSLIADTAEKNTGSIVQLNNNLSTISAGMEECSASSQTIASQLQHVNSNMQQMKDDTSEVKRFTDEICQKAQVIIAEANQNKEASIERMAQINSKLNETSEIAQKISLVQEMTQRIAEIAGQTQILALNARIEAARAGEAGSGFTVVASEVGNLSVEITNTVEEIRLANNEVTDAVTRLIENTSSLGDIVNASTERDYKALVDIGNSYSDSAMIINGKMEELENKAEDISSQIDDMCEGINQMEQTISENAVSINDINAISMEVSEQMQNLNQAAEKNEENAKTLGNNISMYRY